MEMALSIHGYVIAHELRKMWYRPQVFGDELLLAVFAEYAAEGIGDFSQCTVVFNGCNNEGHQVGICGRSLANGVQTGIYLWL